MLKINQLHKSYPIGDSSLHVLKGIDLEVEAGEMVAIMGSSGSGKSTLLNIIGMLDEADSGDYILDGVTIKNLTEKKAAVYRNKFLGFIFQSFNLINYKNALENVALPLYYQGLKRKDRIDHMMRIRDLQDKTGGFNCFIPLVYQSENNYLNIKEFMTAHEILKTMAISRLVIDNVANLKAYWVTSTVNLALLCQEFGANDLDGTIEKESINSAAGAASANGVELQEFFDQSKDTGFTPVERDSLYNALNVW